MPRARHSATGNEEEQMSTESLQGQAGHQTEIHVNNKLVLVVGPRLSGLAIKEAAIGQNVAIQLDFLFV
jgi:hypothetical protein